MRQANNFPPLWILLLSQKAVWILCRALKWSISGAVRCGFHSPFADNQWLPSRLARRRGKKSYVVLWVWHLLSMEDKEASSELFLAQSKYLDYKTRKSTAHTMACTVEDIISPFKCSALQRNCADRFLWQCWIFITFFNKHEQCGRERRGNGCMLYHLWWCTLKVKSICISKKRITCRNFVLEKYVLPLTRNAVYININ